MADDALKGYLRAVEGALRQGNATEHTYRPALKQLIEALAGTGIHAINEPRHIDCGAPDFIVVRGTVPLGYIEAKDVGLDLAKVERSEQLDRYRESLANLVLTDYLEFRWYLDGELRLTASLPRPDRDGHIRWNDEAGSQVGQLLQQFLEADIPLKATPKELATRMAGLARLIRGLIEQAFKDESSVGELHGQREAFRHVLIESLTTEQFADMYAQTLAYGLFAARCNAPASGFTRQIAAGALPKTNPFLRKLFNSIAGPDLDSRIAWAVDQLADVLARADMAAILADFGQRTRKEDPVVHFYETFLAAYDPKMRESRGVYYTPEPVVGYIVRSVDALLRREFGLREGLAHAGKIRWKTLQVRQNVGKTRTSTSIVETEPWVHRLQILDPATGTGTFLYAIIQKIREQFEGNAGAWPAYVAEHLLPRLFGFELLMAPYAVAHMKLGLELEQSGYDFRSDQRLGVFLTNTLEEAHAMTKMPGFSWWLAEEANAASEIKKDAPVMVVLGNPPYSGHSANTGEWIAGLLRGHDKLTNQATDNYFECEGKPLGERNPKWLNDDYVKFIRFAQWRIAQTGYGILAFVTNHGYLDNPTFRGMRESLLKSFDEIYLLDLHGNSKKKEKAPDGSKDENVFDIQQGVAIGIFVKHATSPQSSALEAGERETSAQRLASDAKMLTRVFHADLYGTRALKYAALDAGDVAHTAWQELKPASPTYYFAPEDGSLREEYERGWKITEAMPVNSLGIATARDALCVQFNRGRMWEVVKDFSSIPGESAREKYNLGKDARDWKVGLAQHDVQNSGPSERNLTAILYRPFDVRFTYYTGNTRGFHCMPRATVMNNFFDKRNLALSVTRSIEIERGFEHIFVSNSFTTLHTTSLKEVNYHIPLWIYPHAAEDLLDVAPNERAANFAPEFVAALSKALGRAPSPEDTLAYIYAILYAPSYRARYADFLKRDFPRIPLTSNRVLFDKLVAVGAELIVLHTMERSLPHITGFPVSGGNEVVKVRYTPPSAQPSPAGGRRSKEGAPGRTNNGQVYINDQQYFDGVPEDVWDMHIGGYRVAEKWLKDRKGRLLSYDDLTHYQNVIAALARTLALQGDLDAAIAAAGGWPLS